MKKIIKNSFLKEMEAINDNMKISVILLFLILPVSCNWLDVIPDDLPTLDDAFSNRATAEKSLFSCYSYLPNITQSCTYPAHYTSWDEFAFNYGVQTQLEESPAGRIAKGEQNSNSPLLDYWSGGNGGTSMYQAIRTCNIFLEGIHQPRDIDEYERQRWIAEVKFLKAYFHFFLLQLYGPISLVKDNIPLSAPPDEVRIFREPVDECIDYIVELIDESLTDLPLNINDHTREDGRITRPIALAVKAKVLVWGASPLFNGNSVYQGWRDSRNKQLISDTYSREKWVRAAEAIRIAIEVCHSTQHRLYRYNKLTNASTYLMSDSLVLTMNTRKGITERWNEGIIWSSTYAFADSNAGGMSEFPQYNNMQRQAFPVVFPQDYGTRVGYSYASFNMAELFYTNNGIPMNEDVHWDYADRYKLKLSTSEAKNGLYIPIGQQTVSLHFDREPRFYANLGFDKGFYEISQLTENGGATFNRYLNMRIDGANMPTGYAIKKVVAFETAGNPYMAYDYRFPMLRLADLYLLYSEALNEIKDAPDQEVYDWIDQVRAVAGLKGVVESWKNSIYPNRPSNKDDMRRIIQHERMIELAFEGQRFYDLRRWKLAESSWSYVPLGWNVRGATDEEYYKVMQLAEGRKSSFKDYLWPISNYDLRVNKNLVQTYGW